jgi:hypothetical protein
MEVPTFVTWKLHVSKSESPQRRNLELMASNVLEFYLNADLNVIFRDNQRAIILEYAINVFTSFPKTGVLLNFLP